MKRKSKVYLVNNMELACELIKNINLQENEDVKITLCSPFVCVEWMYFENKHSHSEFMNLYDLVETLNKEEK